MASIILNTIFYPDITNIIIKYVMVKKRTIIYRKKELIISILTDRRKKILFKRDFITDEYYFDEYQRINNLLYDLYYKKNLKKRLIFNI